MNDALKKRLTGAAVLLIAAGLLWPLLFDFDESMRPPQAKFKVEDVPANMLAKEQSRDVESIASTEKTGARAASPARGETLTDRLSAEAEDLATILKNTADAASSAVAGQVTASSRNQPKLDQNRIPVAYVVQVATFNEWRNANNFKQTLLESRFKAYIKPATNAQPGPYRIAVGPVLTYAEAEDIAAKIQREHKIMDAIIRRLRDV